MNDGRAFDAPAPATPSAGAAALRDELDQALTDHLAWLRTWHTTLFAAPGDFADSARYDSHHLCRFGAWFARVRHQGLANQPAMRDLAARHAAMHDKAHALARAAGAGRPLDEAAYAAMMADVEAFLNRARILEKAFAAPGADLDPLTGLPNRQVMRRDLDREHERARRGGDSATVALADLDHFKTLNDTHGHAMGDVVLAATAATLEANLRPYDRVYRYGGEEFLILLPDTGPKRAAVVLERLRAAVAGQHLTAEDGAPITVTISIGHAPLAPERSPEDGAEKADRALYAAKAAGRDRVVGYVPEPPDDAAGQS